MTNGIGSRGMTALKTNQQLTETLLALMKPQITYLEAKKSGLDKLHLCISSCLPALNQRQQKCHVLQRPSMYVNDNKATQTVLTNLEQPQSVPCLLLLTAHQT